MAILIVPAMLRELCGGVNKLEFPAGTVGELLRAVDAEHPGFYERLVDNDRVRPELAFALDGEIVSLALHDTLRPDAEIAIVPAIGGG